VFFRFWIFIVLIPRLAFLDFNLLAFFMGQGGLEGCGSSLLLLMAICYTHDTLFVVVSFDVNEI